MSFSTIHIHLCSPDSKTWNELEAFTTCTTYTTFSLYLQLEFASLAQLVEQLIRNEQVVGSSPIGGSDDFGLRIADCGLRIYC